MFVCFHKHVFSVQPKVLAQLESLAMQTVAAQVSNQRTVATCQADTLAAEGRALAESEDSCKLCAVCKFWKHHILLYFCVLIVAKAKGEASVQTARIDAENRSVLSKVSSIVLSCVDFVRGYPAVVFSTACVRKTDAAISLET